MTQAVRRQAPVGNVTGSGDWVALVVLVYGDCCMPHATKRYVEHVHKTLTDRRATAHRSKDAGAGLVGSRAI